MNNQDFINAYMGDEKLISDYYKTKDKYGKEIVLDGIVSPLKIDNRQLMSPVDNQTTTPHCAAYSAATLVESMHWKKTGILKQIDSHQVYALAKQLDGEADMDGTYLECALRAILKLGGYENADDKIGLFYNDKSQNTIDLTKHLLHKYDFLQVGFAIDEGWYDVTNDNYTIKQRGRRLGGHAVNLCGVDSTGFYIMNQWGTEWGSKGFAVMPFDVYLKELMYGAYLKI